jgi:hypothetical protein
VTQPKLPVFDVRQPDGSVVELDFTTYGPFCDFACTARFADGRERVYGVYHTSETRLFVHVLGHWARALPANEVLAGLDRARRHLAELTEGLPATDESENDFDPVIRHIEQLASTDMPGEDHEHSDESNNVIVLSPRGNALRLISRRTPRTTFEVPGSHLWIFAVGMPWRTYESDGLPLSRLNSAAYDEALAAFEAAIRARLLDEMARDAAAAGLYEVLDEPPPPMR